MKMGWKDYNASIPKSGDNYQRRMPSRTSQGTGTSKGYGKVYTLHVVGVNPKESTITILKKDGKSITIPVEEWKENKYDMAMLGLWLEEKRRVYVKMDLKNKVVVRAFSASPNKVTMREPSPKYSEPKRAEEIFLNNMREGVAMLKNVGYSMSMIRERLERVMREMGYMPLVVLTKERIEEELGRKISEDEYTAIAGAIEEEYLNTSVVDEAVGELISSAVEKSVEKEGGMNMEIGD